MPSRTVSGTRPISGMADRQSQPAHEEPHPSPQGPLWHLPEHATAPLPRASWGGALSTRGYGRRVFPLRLAWKSAMAFLILAWFSGLRASWITLAAIADVASFLNMPAMCGLLLVACSLGARTTRASTTF